MLRKSASDSQAISSRHEPVPLQPPQQQYLYCQCGNMNPERFVRIETFNEQEDRVVNSLVCICHNCEYPVAEHVTGYASCPYCDHDLPQGFDRVPLRPGERLVLCLDCSSAVPARHADRFFRILADQFAQLGCSPASISGSQRGCPACGRGDKLRYSLELLGSSAASETSSRELEVRATCAACGFADAVPDDATTPAATSAAPSATPSMESGAVASASNSSQDDNGTAELDPLIAPYLCDSCPDARFDRLHPVDRRPGGKTVEAAKQGQKPADDELEALFCAGCQSAIPLYCHPAGPASLAELRRAVQPHFSSGAAGLPRERVPVSGVEQLSPGDHVCFPRRGGVYWHHGIVASVDGAAGQYQLVHYGNYTETGQAGKTWWQWLRGSSKGVVQIDTLDLTKEPTTYRLDYHCLDCYPPERVVLRATSQLTAATYHLLGENCEHLAVWAKSGEARSLQVERIRARARELQQRLGPGLQASLKSALVSAKSPDSRTRLLVSESLAFAQKVKRDLSDLLDKRITHQVFSRRLWHQVIRVTFVSVTTALFSLVAPNYAFATRAVVPLAAQLGDAFASLVLPVGEAPTE